MVITSSASRKRSRLSEYGIPYPWYAVWNPLRPTPNSKRPSLTWSSVAPSSATRRGFDSGRTSTEVPMVMRLVRPAMAAPTVIGDEMTRLGVKWNSARQMTSRPRSSAMSTCEKAWV